MKIPRLMTADVGRHHHIAIADLLRTSAIFAVFANHIGEHTRPMLGRHALVLTQLGDWGVNCFFVLSGFLLAGPYFAAILGAGSLPSAKQFWTRRFLRIYPLYAVAVIVTALVHMLTAHDNVAYGDIVLHLFMLHDLTAATALSFNGPLWTMAVDAEFYLLLPLVAFAVHALLRRRTARERAVGLTIVLATLFLGCVVYRFALFWFLPSAMASSQFPERVMFVRNVCGMAGSFALGAMALLATMVRTRQAPAWIARAALAIAAVLTLLPFVYNFDKDGTRSFAAVTRFALSDVVAAVAVAALLYALTQGRLPAVVRFARTRFVVNAAALAYAVYLLHWNTMDVVQSALRIPNGYAGFIELGVVALIVIVPIAFVAHHYVEMPFLVMKKRYADAPAVAASAGEAALVAP